MNNQKYDVITIGSSTIDCFVGTGVNLFQKIAKHDDEPIVKVPFGSKIAVDNLNFLTGGGGTNTAVAFARLGLKTAYIGKFGGDQSDIIRNELKKENISQSLIVNGNNTGFSVILDAKGHDRTILTYKGDNNMMRYSEIEKKNLDAKWFYAASMVEESYKTLVKMIKHASKKGIKVAFNPSSYIAKKGYKKLSSILKCTDVLVFNTEEAGELLGINLPVKEMLRKLKTLLKNKDSIVVVTDGPNGCYCYADKMYYIATNNVPPKETTGAGDAFGSSFIAGLIMGKKIPYCLKMGQANSESVIQYMGAKNVLLSMEQIRKSIKKKPGKVSIMK